MNEENKSSLNSVLAASRGLAVFVAILWHVDILIFAYYPDYKVYSTVFKFLWYIPVPLFFFILGCSFGTIINRERLGLVAAAIGSYLYLYIVWAALYHILFFIVGRNVHELGLLPYIKHVFFPAPELWFVLWMACCLTICTITRRLPQALPLTLTAFTSAVSITSGYKIQNFLIYNLLFTYAGMYFRGPFMDVIYKFKTRAFVISTAIYIPIACATVPLDAFSMPSLAVFESMMGIVSVVSGTAHLQNTTAIKLVAQLGRNAFQIYIIAPLWITLDLKLLSVLYPPGIGVRAELIQSSTLLICAIVLTQAIVTAKILHKKHWLLNPPSYIRHVMDAKITDLLNRYTLPSLLWKKIKNDSAKP